MRPNSALVAVHHGAQVRARGHVGGGGHRAAPQRAHLLRGALGPRLIHLRDDDVRAEPGQLERGGAADAAAAPGDDGDLSRELHGVLPLRGDRG